MASDCLSDSHWKEQAYRPTGSNLPSPIYEQYTYKSPNVPCPGGTPTLINVKLWSHLSDMLQSRVLERGRSRGKKDSKGKSNPNWNVASQTVINLQSRLNTTNFFAMYFFARWDKRTVSTTGGDVPARTWPIDPNDWDLFTPTGGDKTDFDTHVCMYNVFNALGRVANSKGDAQLASGPTSTTTPATYVASFIVYMAHIVALATATEAKRPITDGNQVVYTFDVYASLLWCCRKIKERTYLGTTVLRVPSLWLLLVQCGQTGTGRAGP
jgi:hypothetical protein